MAKDPRHEQAVKRVNDSNRRNSPPRKKSLNERIFGGGWVSKNNNNTRGNQVTQKDLLQRRENYSPELADSYKRDVALAEQARPYLNLPNEQGPQAGFDPYEAHARLQQERGLTTIANKFLGMGSGAADTSPDLYRALGNSQAEFESMLASQRSQYGLNNEQAQANNFFRLKNPSQGALGGQYTNVYRDPRDEGYDDDDGDGSPLWKKMLGTVAQLGGSTLGAFFGGPVGGAIGNTAGKITNDLLNRRQAPQNGYFNDQQMMDAGTNVAGRFRNEFGRQQNTDENLKPYDPNGPKLADRFNYIPH